MVGRIGRFDHGLAGVTRWQVRDETHLPDSPKLAPAYAPVQPKLAEILRRPTLDERLPDMLSPPFVSPELMDPTVMSDTRREAAQSFRSLAAGARAGDGSLAGAMAKAAEVLEEDVVLDEEIREALAALLRG